MSDDFLKKIQKTETSKNSNPFDRIFKEKQNTIKNNEYKEPEKEKEGIDGIENLGKTGTPNIDNTENKTEVEKKDIDKELPAKNMHNDNILENLNEATDESVNSIPTKDMYKSDIFKDTSNNAEDNLSFQTSSSYKNLDLEKGNISNPFTDNIINKIILLLKNNKVKDAIALIKDTNNV